MSWDPFLLTDICHFFPFPTSSPTLSGRDVVLYQRAYQILWFLSLSASWKAEIMARKYTGWRTLFTLFGCVCSTRVASNILGSKDKFFEWPADCRKLWYNKKRRDGRFPPFFCECVDAISHDDPGYPFRIINAYSFLIEFSSSFYQIEPKKEAC